MSCERDNVLESHFSNLAAIIVNMSTADDHPFDLFALFEEDGGLEQIEDPFPRTDKTRSAHQDVIGFNFERCAELRRFQRIRF